MAQVPWVRDRRWPQVCSEARLPCSEGCSEAAAPAGYTSSGLSWSRPGRVRQPQPWDGLGPLRMGCQGSFLLSSPSSAPQAASDPGGPWPPQLPAPGAALGPGWSPEEPASSGGPHPKAGEEARASYPLTSLCPGGGGLWFPEPRAHQPPGLLAPSSPPHPHPYPLHPASQAPAGAGMLLSTAKCTLLRVPWTARRSSQSILKDQS